MIKQVSKEGIAVYLNVALWNSTLKYIDQAHGLILVLASDILEVLQHCKDAVIGIPAVMK